MIKVELTQPMAAAALRTWIIALSLTGGSVSMGQTMAPQSGPLVGPPYASFDGSGYGALGGPLDPRYRPPGYGVPRSVRIHSQIVAAPPLPAANLVLSHRRNESLQVEIYDRQKGKSVFRGEIPPGGSVEVSLLRDSGGYVNEIYQSIGSYGEVVERKVTRALPIDIRYDVVVHRYQVQSIAIDRTGKSPSPIEDIQYQSQGVGRFSLPAGMQLIDGQIDVYRNAVAAGNAALVAPLQLPTQSDGPASDPLRRAIEELRQR